MRQNVISRLNVLVVIESFYDGGAEMFAIRLANAVSDKVNLYFLELYPYRSSVKKQKLLIDTERIEFVELGKNFIGDILNSTFLKGKLKNKLNRLYQFVNKIFIVAFIRNRKIQIVHSHSWESDLYFSKIKSSVDFSFITTFHGHYELNKDRGAFFVRNAKFILDKTDMVVYLTNVHEQTLNELGVAVEKRKRIFHGLDRRIAKVEKKLENNIVKFALVARGIPEKGWEESIAVVLHLNEQYPGRVELHLIGDSDYVKALKLKYNYSFIYFYGYLEDVFPIIQNVHVGLLPSTYKAESLPLCIIEFLFCGKPVIASNIGAIKDMLECNNEYAGYVIDLKNESIDEKSFIEAASSYLNDSSLLVMHSQLALLAAKKFDMQICMDSYIALYNGIMVHHDV